MRPVGGKSYVGVCFSARCAAWWSQELSHLLSTPGTTIDDLLDQNCSFREWRFYNYNILALSNPLKMD